MSNNNQLKLSFIPVLFVVLIHLSLLALFLIYLGYEVPVSLLISFGIYLGLGCVAISPVGEWILRVFCGARAIQREDWNRKVSNALNDVYNAVEQKDTCISSDIKLYYIYSPIQTSLSFGRKTICLSSALLESSERTIRAYIAHELGHIQAADSIMFLLANIGNFPWILLGSILRLFSRGLRFFSLFNRFRFMGFLLFVFSLILYIPRCVIWIYLTVTRLIVSIGNRRKEYEADAFCVMLGFGRELRAALLSSDIDAQTNSRDLWQSMIASHPGAYDRVGRIDKMMRLGCDSSSHRDLFEVLLEG